MISPQTKQNKECREESPKRRYTVITAAGGKNHGMDEIY